jgi:glycosyltransferase involved in cell wall biosynthesis
LQHLAELADVRVVSPMAAVYYGLAGKRLMGLKGIEGPVADGRLMVEYPRWVYPPGMGWAHGWWLNRFSQATVEMVRREFRFEVIDAHFGHPEASAARWLAQRFGVPFTVTLRGNETAHGRDPKKRQRMAEALRTAARVIAVSGPLRDFAIELGVRPDRAVVIPNGIDAAVFHPRDRGAERARLGMGDGELHILSAGYLMERKGHHRIIETLPGLRARGLKVRLWIAGEKGPEGDFEGEIRRRVAECGVEDAVNFVGAVAPAELAFYMSACDVFCLASNREGWPNVVNEALACGAPVVATNVGGVPAMIVDERFGRVIPPGDSAALEDALARALTGAWDREAISAQGLKRSWGEVAREVFEQLSAAAEENRQ